ncbi:adhesion G protein-coupled receptor L3-like [Uloborus diversus]|uniref:adhesion G protein-coupled receptor L3-like n=1 Tax=Uloborus diversus TaxID=327109 RepID=UPI00240A1EA0|nr:adhesion G protein-coupled receptor L3-like [Uloborus diversus]
MWNLTVPGPVKNNTWSQIGLLWTKETGLEMFVNNVSVGHVKYPDKVDPPQLRDQPMELTVGCRKTQDGDYTDFAYGEYDELTAWMWALEEEQKIYFLGGYDCDPELHPLNCETNLEKILKKMDNADMESTAALAESLDHLKMLSEVEKDPAGSDKEEDKNAETRNKEEIKTFVAIIEKLIVNTWNEPNNLEIGDLESMLAVQDLASNLLDEKYYDGWQAMQNDGLASVGFMNRVTEYIMQKMSQTDIGKEPMTMEKNSKNIYSDLRKSSLFDILHGDELITYPEVKKDEESNQRRRKKRETEGNDQTPEDEPKVQVMVTKELYGDVNKYEKVSFVGSSYKSLDRLSPLWNKRTGNFTTLIFIDSEIVTVRSDPNASSAALEKEPVLVKMKHRRNAKATGRKLMADKELEENGEVRNRECVRWDPNLQARGSRAKGGWSPDGCSIANTSAEESTCKCTMLGTYAILSKIRQPFDIPPEDEWVKICKWIGFGVSIILLVLYIFVILIRKKLHEPFHIIRLNLALAALGALVSFCLSGFLFDDESTCRILSITIHLFYTAVGTWLIAEAHALFSTLVNGAIGGKFTLYFMIGWVAPAGMVGGCYTVIVDYGYDYRCLVGPTASMRWLLVSPILISSLVAFTFSLLTCINYGTPAIKKTVIVNELRYVNIFKSHNFLKYEFLPTRSSFIVTLLFFSTWVCGIFALIDLGFDGGEIPAFNPIFQILNSCLGVFIVALIGLGSKHFRYCLCHAGRSTTQTKALNLDPFDIHDKAKISNMKKIYTAN